MTHKVLIDVLSKAGKREGDVIRLSDDSDITLFAALGNHTLTIDKIHTVECNTDVLVAITRKQDQFVLAYEDVRALRIGATKPRAGLHPV